MLLVGAGAAGVLLGVFLLFTFLGPADDSTAVDLSTRPSVVRPQATEGQTRPGPSASEAPLVRGHDPFRQLAGATPAPRPDTVAPPSPQASPPPTPTGTQPAQGYATLELLSVYTDDTGVQRAHMTVDGRPFDPAQGEVFSYGFRLERIDGQCVQVSSQGEKVDMCVAAAGTGG